MHSNIRRRSCEKGGAGGRRKYKRMEDEVTVREDDVLS